MRGRQEECSRPGGRFQGGIEEDSKGGRTPGDRGAGSRRRLDPDEPHAPEGDTRSREGAGEQSQAEKERKRKNAFAGSQRLLYDSDGEWYQHAGERGV